jgi:hypothetical protein
MAVLKMIRGRDCEKQLNGAELQGVSHAHSALALSVLEEYRIGRLTNDPKKSYFFASNSAQSMVQGDDAPRAPQEEAEADDADAEVPETAHPPSAEPTIIAPETAAAPPRCARCRARALQV